MTVPRIIVDPADPDDADNHLIDLKSGRLLAIIQGETGFDHMNHGGVLPARWSSDSSLLLWVVDGKWGPDTVVLIRLKNGKVEQQINLLTLAQKAILARTKAAAPKRYATAKAENAGSGRAYPEGFTVDMDVSDPIALPLRFTVALTSDPKLDLPPLASHLEGNLDESGKLHVTSFGLGAGKSSHF